MSDAEIILIYSDLLRSSFMDREQARQHILRDLAKNPGTRVWDACGVIR